MLFARRRSPSPLLVACLLGTLLPGPFALLHADRGDDGPCASAAARHDPAAHRITADGRQADGEHCYVCHGLCSVRPIVVSRAAIVPDQREHRTSSRPSRTHRNRLDSTRVPARAPPGPIRHG
jgi:hypothetical protein